jgi:hypothetical protein
LRIANDRAHRSRLDEAAAYMTAMRSDISDRDADIMRDEQHRHLQLGLNSVQQLENLDLDGGVERRRRLLGKQARSAGQGQRDHGALTHA